MTLSQKPKSGGIRAITIVMARIPLTGARMNRFIDAMSNKESKEVIDQLANAMQTVNLRAAQLRRTLGESSEDAVQLATAADRAVRLIKRLQPKDRES